MTKNSILWKKQATLESLNSQNKNTIHESLGIEWTEIGPDFLSAQMPVDPRTMQPFGLLHGGASVVLAESLGSVAAFIADEDPKAQIVGIEINASHLKSAKNGVVLGTVTAIKVGKKLQTWSIEIKQNDALICTARLTTLKLN